MTTFNELGLSTPLLKSISELGFHAPTEIQEQTIPQLLRQSQDFIGLAQTGTGKTAAFGLPLLELIDTSNKATQALILAPTRELGQQIADQLQTFARHKEKVNILAVYGGAPINSQLKALKKPQHIIIATPGRLLDLIKRKAVILQNLQFLVLDEADEMLNMGFKEELDHILAHTPNEKLTWLFSATMPKEIRRIVNKYMSEPAEVRVNSQSKVNVDIAHRYAAVKQPHKTEALTRFLDAQPGMRGLVFCRTRRDTQKLADNLIKMQYSADAIHGDLSQRQRDVVLNRFKAHGLRVLVATDVAARGIDVNGITHVFHYSLPDDSSFYTHRSGRTARAGKKGTSIAFVNGNEHRKITQMAQQLGIQFKKELVPSANDIAEKHVESWCRHILEKRTRGTLDPELLEKAHILFGSLTKEELTAKMLANEIGKISPESGLDLNAENHSSPQKNGKNRKKHHNKFSNRKKGKQPKRNRYKKRA